MGDFIYSKTYDIPNTRVPVLFISAFEQKHI